MSESQSLLVGQRVGCRGLHRSWCHRAGDLVILCVKIEREIGTACGAYREGRAECHRGCIVGLEQLDAHVAGIAGTGSRGDHAIAGIWGVGIQCGAHVQVAGAASERDAERRGARRSSCTGEATGRHGRQGNHHVLASRTYATGGCGERHSAGIEIHEGVGVGGGTTTNKIFSEEVSHIRFIDADIINLPLSKQRSGRNLISTGGQDAGGKKLERTGIGELYRAAAVGGAVVYGYGGA